MNISQGAKIVAKDWLKIKNEEKLLIITDETHVEEAMCLKEEGAKLGALAVVMIVPEHCPQLGHLFDDMIDLFKNNDVIVGATNYSLITTNAVKEAIKHGKRYLSMPLSSNDGKSVLTADFMTMDTELAKDRALRVISYLDKVDDVKVVSENGTSMTFRKQNRKVSYFNGVAEKPGDFASSSFEVYFAMEEDKTNGTVILDGSFGYIGAVKEPTKLTFKNGKLISIEETEAGKKLKEYMEHFNDEGIYVAGEFGIGLNEKAKCIGRSYIEDESTYGTFHIGMGRNLALGGVHDAKGHFDLVFDKPNIYAGDTLIIKEGKIIV